MILNTTAPCVRHGKSHGLAYQIEGNGPFVVLIHGLGLSRAQWKYLHQYLQPGLRVLSYDLPGHGGSDALPPASCASISLRALAAQLRTLLCTLHVQRCALVGFSLGGMIARRFALDYPQQVTALAILHSPHARSDEERAAVMMRMQQVQTAQAQKALAIAPHIIDAALVRWFTPAYQKNNPAIMQCIRDWLSTCDVSTYVQMYRLLAEGDVELAQCIRRVQCPTLVLTSSDDHGNSPVMAKKMAELIPHARVHIVDGLRHLALVEAPARVNRPLCAFLQETLCGDNSSATSCIVDGGEECAGDDGDAHVHHDDSDDNDDGDNINIVHLKVPMAYSNWRLDKTLAALLPEHSRSTLQRYVRERRVFVCDENNSRQRVYENQRATVYGGERIQIYISMQTLEECTPQAMELTVVHEDEYILILNKAPGLVVHPGAGNLDGTLVHGLLHYDASLVQLPRAGLVHRLDKDTSGLLIVARNEATRLALIEQLRARNIKREYCAIVNGLMIADGVIDEPLGRHPKHRVRMAVVANGKAARTHYTVQQRYRAHTCIAVTLETGRTHQIRVHLAHIGFPLLGDALYGARVHAPRGAAEALHVQLRGFKRQSLHACALSFNHPKSGVVLNLQCAPPPDMQELMKVLALDEKINRDVDGK